MATRRSNLEDHIATLEKFETLYGELLVERRNRERSWSGEEWARRERELKELAPQAEAAMVATGETRWDEGPVRIDLPSRILRFVDEGDGVTDDTDQWQILDGIPTNIGALKGKLRSADGPKRRRTPRHGLSALWHEPNPWVLVVVGTVVATIIAALLIAKFS